MYVGRRRMNFAELHGCILLSIVLLILQLDTAEAKFCSFSGTAATSEQNRQCDALEKKTDLLSDDTDCGWHSAR